MGIHLPAVLVACLTFTGCASTDNWSATDTKLEIGYQVTNIADALTTANIREHPANTEATWPTKQLLGPNPQPGDVALYFATAGVAHFLISRILSAKWRRRFQTVTFVSSAYWVTHNCNEGLC